MFVRYPSISLGPQADDGIGPSRPEENYFMKRIAATATTLGLMLCIGGVQASNNLSRIYVYGVTSTKGGYESIPQGGSWTVKDHGGSVMRVITDEIGYGNNAQARLLGSPLREVGTQPLCNVGGRAQPCNRGTIVGYRRTWEASSREGGNFEFMVSPNGVGSWKRTTLQIR
jgi:hypothetical protein